MQIMSVLDCLLQQRWLATPARYLFFFVSILHFHVYSMNLQAAVVSRMLRTIRNKKYNPVQPTVIWMSGNLHLSLTLNILISHS